MSLVTDIITPTTREEWYDRIVALATAVGLAVTAWVGMPSEQWQQIMAALFQLISEIVVSANRAQFLDTAVDPGDEDDLPPAEGWLSKKGAGDYGTERIDATFATGFVTLTNSGGVTHQIRPEDLTFQSDVSGKNYKNSDDDALYPAPSKILTLAPSDEVTIPIRAVEVGAASNAGGGDIGTLVSALSGVTVTNESPVLGTDRENYLVYRERCRRASAATSPNGPAAAYEYLIARTNIDGTLSEPGDGKTIVNVTRFNILKDSSVGLVSMWLASPSGAATSEDVTAVETLLDNLYAPDCVTRIIEAATPITLDVTATVYANDVPGVSEEDIIAAIEAEMVSFFASIPVGGFDGFVDKEHVKARIFAAYSGIYRVPVMTEPAAGLVSINEDEVPVLGTVTITVTLT